MSKKNKNRKPSKRDHKQRLAARNRRLASQPNSPTEVSSAETTETPEVPVAPHEAAETHAEGEVVPAAGQKTKPGTQGRGKGKGKRKQPSNRFDSQPRSVGKRFWRM
ncbi:MAG: hypothetical protein AAF525_17715 [Pseudomonadota bacterium]